MLIMHSLVLASSQLILEGDIAGAERTLVALADQAGDHALVRVLDELPPKDLLAVMREFDASKESIINLLVTPEQFARAIVLEKKYGDRTGEKLRGMMNAVIHQHSEHTVEYLETIGNYEGGSSALADYFEDRYDEIFSFAATGSFQPSFQVESGPSTHNTWLMEKIEELDHGLGWGDSIESARPKVSRAEVADGDWMETAWLLCYELPDVFEEIMLLLRERALKWMEAMESELLSGAADSTTGNKAASLEIEESAI